MRLTAEAGFDWISDTYDDDLPYWIEAGSRDQLVIPYTLEANDMRFATAPGYIEGEQFFTYLKDASTRSMPKARPGRPKMMSHRSALPPDRPARQDRRAETLPRSRARSRRRLVRTPPRHRPPLGANPSAAPVASGPARWTSAAFVARFGGVFEHSPWIAERACGLELGPAHDTATGLASAFARVFRSAVRAERLGVLTAHPDLAGKLAAARRLTPDSTAEQASAALDALTDAERTTFGELNAAYIARHGFPFVIAVRDHTKACYPRRLPAPPCQ